MKRVFVAAVLIAGLLPSLSRAVDVTNIRARYGPIGSYRSDKKLLPGDTILMTFDIEGLALDPKTGKASYDTIVELLEGGADGKVIYKNPTENEAVPQLGGTTLPGDLRLTMGLKHAPGKYTVKVTVQDKIGKNAKAFFYNFDLLPASFGIIQVSAPAIGLLGQHYVASFGLVNLTLDAKKQPNTDLQITIFDQAGKAVAPAVKMNYPRDTPMGVDLTVENFVPVPYPVYLNRVGRYTLEVVAQDKNDKNGKKVEMRFPFTVLDLNSFSK